MSHLRGFLIILLSSLAGNIISSVSGLSVPGSIFGMLILLVLLLTKVVKLETVEPSASLLISLMIVMFIPSTVNLMNVYDKFLSMLPQVLIIGIVSTIITIGVSAWTIDKLLSKKEETDGNSH